MKLSGYCFAWTNKKVDFRNVFYYRGDDTSEYWGFRLLKERLSN